MKWGAKGDLAPGCQDRVHSLIQGSTTMKFLSLLLINTQKSWSLAGLPTLGIYPQKFDFWEFTEILGIWGFSGDFQPLLDNFLEFYSWHR